MSLMRPESCNNRRQLRMLIPPTEPRSTSQSGADGEGIADEDTLPALCGNGDVFDDFKIIRMLGRGGMGEVYLARDTKLGRKVALKMIRPERVGSPSAKAAFLSEARVTAKFSHPNIVTIHAVGEHEGTPYVALEYLDGDDLAQRMARRRLSVQESIRIGLAIAGALDEAHRNGILHLDLKPENVVMPRDGRLRVVDFGLSKIVHTKEGGPRQEGGLPRKAVLHPDDDAIEDGITAYDAESWGAMGTPAYMAPEQWLGDPCSGATDVWALGMILFELCGDELPYYEPTMAKQFAAVCSPSAVPQVENFADLPSDLADVINRCLEKVADERPSAAEVAAQLRQHSKERHEQTDNPFRGLLPFTERHANVFYGRDPEIAAVVERIWIEPVLAVVGPSGSGKSSFVQAGVIPRLQEQEPWIVLQVRPGERPLNALAKSLVRTDTTAGARTGASLPPGALVSTDVESEALGNKILESPAQLSLELQTIAELRNSKVLLFVDQLEELFTLVEDEATRRAFMTAICTAADDPLDPVRVIFTVRDDFLGRLATGAAVREALSHVTIIESLGTDALIETLTKPVEALGYRYEDSTLVEEMVASMSGERAALPLLQFAAQILWEKRDRDRRLLLKSAHDALGGVEGALAQHAAAVLDGFTARELAAARQLLLQLVTPERTRKVVSKARALEMGGDSIEHVLSRLTQARLITTSKRRDESGDAQLELAHESLIRSWQTLAHWIDESKDEIAFLAEVGQAAELWSKRGRLRDELWQGEALQDALRTQRRCAAEVPGNVAQFLAAGDAESRRLAGLKRKLIVVVITLLTTVAGAAVAAMLVIADREQEANTQRDRAEMREATANQERAEALRDSARLALGSGAVLEARAKLRMALEAHDDVSTRALWRQLEADPLLWRKVIGSTAYRVEISPDGAKVAAASQSGTVYLFDAVTGAARMLRGHRDQVFAIAFSPNGRLLASGGWDGQVRLWDLKSGTSRLLSHKRKVAVRGVSFSPDGRQLATACHDGVVRIWNVSNGNEVLALEGHTLPVFAVRFSPDGRLLASSSSDATVKLWDVASGKALRTLRGHTAAIPAVSFSPDGQLLVSAGLDASARLWSVRSGKQVRVLEGHGVSIRGVAFSRDGRRIATASYDKTIKLWNASTGKEEATLRGHTDRVYGVSFSSDGMRLASGSSDGSVRLWNLSKRPHSLKQPGHKGSVADVTFSPDGQRIASSGADETIRLWEVGSGNTQRVLRGHTGKVRTVRFSPDGAMLASGSADKTVRLWDLGSSAEAVVLSGHRGEIYGVSFRPDGKELASGGVDKSIRLWKVSSGVQSEVLTGHERAVLGVAFAPDGRRLVSVSVDRSLRIWNLASQAAGSALTGHTNAVFGVAFSPDGSRVASGSTDGTVRLWNLRAASSTVLGRHPERVYGVAFDSSGQHVAASSSDGTARLWNVDSGEHKALRGHMAEVNAIAFSPDGKLVATASDDGTVRLWNAATGSAVWRAPALLAGPPRLFTHQGWLLLDGESVVDMPQTEWIKAIEARALSVSHTLAGVGARACLSTLDDELELWDTQADKLVATHRLVGFQQALAHADACVARTSDAVHLLTASGTLRKLAIDGKPSTMALGGDRILVSTPTAVVAFDGSGAAVGRYPASAPASAMAYAGDWVVMGYRDGSIELLDTNQTKPSFSFEHTPSSAPTRIVVGPKETLIIGYADGTLGIWNRLDGERLGYTQLHGPVTHLLLEHGKLYAATDLGQHLVWDLSAFYQEYCDLLVDVQQQVPVVWASGQPALAATRAQRACP